MLTICKKKTSNIIKTIRDKGVVGERIIIFVSVPVPWGVKEFTNSRSKVKEYSLSKQGKGPNIESNTGLEG